MGERRPQGTPEEQQREREQQEQRDKEQHEREQRERVAQQRGTSDMITTSEGPRPAQPTQQGQQSPQQHPSQHGQPPQQPQGPEAAQRTELGHPGHNRNAEPLQQMRSAFANARQAAMRIESGQGLANILAQVANVERALEDYMREQEQAAQVQHTGQMQAPQHAQGELANRVTDSHGHTATATAEEAAREPKEAVERDLHEVKESNKQGT